jgi:2-oxoglutarate dehydrogenase E2 component (dihydrolipoamide succinyltransferase)
MSLAVKIPAVGESIAEVTLAQWLVTDGAAVQLDQPICELESEKATFELNAEAAGILRQGAKPGDVLKIGDVLCTIDTDGTAPVPEKKEAGREAPAAAPADSPVKTGKIVEMSVPAVGESITEVTISSWTRKNGDLVAMDEVLAEVESDKATFELTAEAPGYLEILAEAGKPVAVGAPVCRIAEVKGVPAGDGEKAASVPAPAEKQAGYAAGHPSPAAAKILAEKGIAPASVPGSGRDGRITKEDALKAQAPAAGAPAESAPGEAGAPVQAAPAPGIRTERAENMSTLRKTIARRLVAVKNETAMLTTFNEVNMKPIMDLRARYKDQFKEKFEVGLGFMSFFTKACCTALLEWPAVNARIDGDRIVYHEFCDISIAVSTPRGLVVPVLRNAERMSFEQIEKEILRLAQRARDGKLSIEEMQGGTFTITNGGVFGSMLSTPIINAPQSAILGMHNIVERPVAEGGQVVIRPVMYLALSYDHRLIDGRESVSFLVRVKQLLEDPARLLLGV